MSFWQSLNNVFAACKFESSSVNVKKWFAKWKETREANFLICNFEKEKKYEADLDANEVKYYEETIIYLTNKHFKLCFVLNLVILSVQWDRDMHHFDNCLTKLLPKLQNLSQKRRISRNKCPLFFYIDSILKCTLFLLEPIATDIGDWLWS